MNLISLKLLSKFQNETFVWPQGPFKTSATSECLTIILEWYPSLENEFIMNSRWQGETEFSAVAIMSKNDVRYNFFWFCYILTWERHGKTLFLNYYRGRGSVSANCETKNCLKLHFDANAYLKLKKNNTQNFLTIMR